MNIEHAQVGAFRLDDRVRVVGGTFIGMEGRVIDIAQVRTLCTARRPRPGYEMPARLRLACAANFRLGSAHPVDLRSSSTRCAVMTRISPETHGIRLF